jgi:hypothetical protein
LFSFGGMMAMRRTLVLSHFDSFFGVFMSQERFSKAFFANFLPLSPNENSVLTFLQ